MHCTDVLLTAAALAQRLATCARLPASFLPVCLLVLLLPQTLDDSISRAQTAIPRYKSRVIAF